MKALDLFCGAGGASMGLHRAGFDVVGVDIRPQPRYPFAFIQADAMEFPLEGFDFVWASPPCQDYTTVSNVAKHRYGSKFADLIEPLRARLMAPRRPTMWVMENVVSAPLRPPAIILCGLNFHLRLLRHRAFESNFPMLAPPHIRHKRGMAVRREVFTVCGGSGGRTNYRPNGQTYKRANLVEAKQAMAIDWMTLLEIAQAVPPAYSEFIGKQAMAYLVDQ